MNIDDITGLEEELASKAEAVHTHPTSDIVGLVAALADKAPLDHTHDLGDFPDFTTAVGNFSPIGHTHNQNEIAGLTNALSGKANFTHTHPTSQITDLDSTLAAKSNVGHTHPISQIEGLSEIVGDTFTLQANWTETDPTGIGYIVNKPTLGNASTKDVGTASNNVAAGTHTHSANDIVGGTLNANVLPPLNATNIGAAPATHAHGNIQSNGSLGTLPHRLAITTSGGVLDALTSSGTSGQVLTSAGTSGPPAWAAAPAPTSVPAASITGTLAIERIPTGTTAETVALGNHTHTNFVITDESATISQISRLTQAAYNSLSPKLPNTLYVIVG